MLVWRIIRPGNCDSGIEVNVMALHSLPVITFKITLGEKTLRKKKKKSLSLTIIMRDPESRDSVKMNFYIKKLFPSRNRHITRFQIQTF